MNMPDDFDLSSLSPNQQLQMRQIELDLEDKDIEHMRAANIYLAFKVLQTQNATRAVVANMIKDRGV